MLRDDPLLANVGNRVTVLQAAWIERMDQQGPLCCIRRTESGYSCLPLAGPSVIVLERPSFLDISLAGFRFTALCLAPSG